MSLRSDILIRSASIDDAHILTALHRECFSHYWNVDEFNNFFAVAGTYALIAEDSKPVAMVVYRVSHEQADIMTIVVLPSWRKRGIAEALLKEAIADIVAKGSESLFLDVEDGNSPAIALYEKFGFTQQKRRKLYYRQKDGSFTDALVMERKL